MNDKQIIETQTKLIEAMQGLIDSNDRQITILKNIVEELRGIINNKDSIITLLKENTEQQKLSFAKLLGNLLGNFK